MTTFPAPSAGVTSVDNRYCIKCGYLLRGLSPSGNCPECGTSIALSLREPTLAGADKDYLRTINRGLSLVLNGILLMVLVVIGTLVIGFAGAVAGLPPGTSTAIAAGGSLLASVMMLAGYWLYTQPDPSQVALEHQHAARKVIRVAVAISAAIALTQLVLALGFNVGAAPAPRGKGVGQGAARDTMEVVNDVLGWVGFAAWAVQFFAMMRYTRWVAGRVPDEYIVRRTRTYMWLLPVLTTVGVLLIGLGPLIALILYWNLLDRLRKHTKSIVRGGRPTVV